MTTIYYALFFCAGVLLFVLGYLIKLNWGEKIQAPIITISLVGVGTMITAIFSNLKETNYKKRISINLTVDAQNRLFQPTGSTSLERYKVFSSQNVIKAEYLTSKPNEIGKANINFLEVNTEALALGVLNTILLATADVQMIQGNTHLGYLTLKLPSNATSVKESDFKFKLKNQTILNYQTPQFLKLAKLPPQTKVTVQDIQVENTGRVVEIILEKKNFFCITFRFNKSTSPIPQEVKQSDEKIFSYTTDLRCNAHFEKISSSNAFTQEYIDFGNSIIDMVAERYGN